MTQTPHDQPSLISKVAAAGVGSFATTKFLQYQKVMFNHRSVTKSLVNRENCLYLKVSSVQPYDGITQNLQDHLFQKSWQRGFGSFATYSKLKKVLFHRGIVTKSFVSVVNWLNLIILCVYYYNGMRQKPHDYLF